MKLRQQHVKTFKNQVEELRDTNIPKVLKACDAWLRIQQQREAYGNTDQYWAQVAREKIEKELDEFRDKLGELYDHMSERGLRNIA